MGEWRGINSPRHQTSHWLKVVEKGSVRRTDAMLFLGVGSSGAEDPVAKPPLLAFT
jgi:hypothetical protein